MNLAQGYPLSMAPKIAWGRGGKIEEIAVVGEWEGYIVVYGIVGILELFSCACSYLRF